MLIPFGATDRGGTCDSGPTSVPFVSSDRYKLVTHISVGVTPGKCGNETPLQPSDTSVPAGFGPTWRPFQAAGESRIMDSDNIDLLLHELDDQNDQQLGQSSDLPTYPSEENDRPGDTSSMGWRLERSFASEYLDELIITILLRRGEANGMDIIRELTHLFGVQFSPGTVYPHLHSLEDEGVLECRECVQTKEYSIDDRQTAREYIDSTVGQLSRLSEYLDVTVRELDHANDGHQHPEGADS